MAKTRITLESIIAETPVSKIFEYWGYKPNTQFSLFYRCKPWELTFDTLKIPDKEVYLFYALYNAITQDDRYKNDIVAFDIVKLGFGRVFLQRFFPLSHPEVQKKVNIDAYTEIMSEKENEFALKLILHYFATPHYKKPSREPALVVGQKPLETFPYEEPVNSTNDNTATSIANYPKISDDTKTEV